MANDPSPTEIRNTAIIKVFDTHIAPAVLSWRAAEMKSQDAFLAMLDTTADAVMTYMVEKDPGGKWILKADYRAFFEDNGIKQGNNARHPFNAPFKFALYGDLAWGVPESTLKDDQRKAMKTATEETSRYANIAAWALRYDKKPSEIIAEQGGLRMAADFYSLTDTANLNSTKEKSENEADRLERLEHERQARVQKKLEDERNAAVNKEIVKDTSKKTEVTKQENKEAEKAAQEAAKAADRASKELKKAEDERKRLAKLQEENEARRKKLEKDAEDQKRLNEQREKAAKEEQARLEAQEKQHAKEAAEQKKRDEAEAARQKKLEAEAKKRADAEAKKAKEAQFKPVPFPNPSQLVLKTFGDHIDLLVHVKKIDGKWMIIDRPIPYTAIGHEAKEANGKHAGNGDAKHAPEQPSA